MTNVQGIFLKLIYDDDICGLNDHINDLIFCHILEHNYHNSMKSMLQKLFALLGNECVESGLLFAALTASR